MSRHRGSRSSGARFTAGVGALFVVGVVGFLCAWVLVPRLILGWQPIAITSESMAPAINRGDVVLAVADDGHGLVPGTVAVFRDPAQTGLVTHRVRSVNPDGTYATKGDASRDADSTPLSPDSVVGVGRMLVPFVGFPVVWWTTGSWLHLAGVLAGLITFAWMACWAFLAAPPAHPDRADARQGPTAAATVGVVLVLVATVPTASRAAFAAPTANAGTTFTAGPFTQDSFRVSTYEVGDGVFTGLTYSLTLDQDLAPDYFVMLRGAAGANDPGTNRNPNQNYVRVSGDPYSNLSAVTASNQLELSRRAAASSWKGQVTIIESLSNRTTSGFRLLDVVEVGMGPGAATASAATSTAWSDISQVGLYGGIRGGGVSTTTAVRADHQTAWARIYPEASNTVTLERRAGGGGSLSGSTVFTVYAIEWGTEWTIQRATVSGSSGGNGVNLPRHYDVASIAPTPRDSTFVTANGTSTDNGLGDGWEGQIFTLGNGVTQLASERTVAVGGEYTDSRVAEVYVHTHPSLAVDYRFGVDGASPGIASRALSGTAAIDAALAGESYTSGPGIEATTGDRFAVISNSSSGAGIAYPRPMIWARPTDPVTATWTRSRSGQPGAYWLQIVDFANIS